MINFKQLEEAWESGLTRRWHTNTHLSHTTDYTCGHTGRMATMAVILGWDTLELLRAIAKHDKGEKRVGDFSYTFKKEQPELAAQIDECEFACVARMGFSPDNLSELEANRLKVLDQLDAVYWMRVHRPDLEVNADWQYLVSDTLKKLNKYEMEA